MSGGSAKRLVCIVEGQGEEAAIPALCIRVRDYLEAWTWLVDDDPIRRPRSLLVDQRVPSPKRPARQDELDRALHMALARAPAAVLLLCDADDDCAVTWAKSADTILRTRTVGAAVMAVREYEAWLLASKLNATASRGRPIDQIASPKDRLRELVPRYKPSVHQLPLTRGIDVAALRRLSRSFDKLVRTLATLFGAEDPTNAAQLQPRRPKA